MRGTLRRIRSLSGHLALLAALAAVATLLLVAAPQAANGFADAGLAQRVASLPYQVRDVTFSYRPQPAEQGPRPSGLNDVGVRVAAALASPLRERISEHWYGLQVSQQEVRALGEGLPTSGGGPMLGLRFQTGIESAARLVDGRWPGNEYDGSPPVEVAISDQVAQGLGLHVGSTFTLALDIARQVRLPVVIVGIFAADDAGAPVWDQEPMLLKPDAPLARDGVPWRAVLLVDPPGITSALTVGMPVTFSWRYRIDPESVTTADIDEVADAAVAARTSGVEIAYRGPRVSGQTGLAGALLGYAAQLGTLRAILAIAQSGVVATLFGLVLLAARGMVERRRVELVLLRARGASAVVLGRRLVTETAAVVPLAVAAAWLVSRQVPGRPGSADWVAVVFAVATMLAVPVLATAGYGRRSRPVNRASRVASTRGLGASALRLASSRVTLELSLLVLAGLGVVLLRRRGLAPPGGVDLYLASVPVLLALAIAAVALRLYPWPLRQLAHLAGRAKGAVGFLGLARAGRAVSAGPLAALVIAVGTGVFSAVVTMAVIEGRDGATDQVLPADVDVSGFYFTPQTTQRLAAIGGVTSVTPYSREPAARLLTGTDLDAQPLTQVLVVTVDAPAFARVIAESGVAVELPASFLTAARSSDAVVPAVVSPDVAADVGTGGAVDVQGQLYPFSVSTVAETFPSLPIGARRFVVLPLQAMVQPQGKPVLPNGFLLAGDGIDLDALTRVGDEGQREWQSDASGAEVAVPARPTTAVTWQQRRTELERSGVNALLNFAFLVGAAGGTGLALLAVGFAVASGARVRGQTRSRLRTMGLSRGQGRLMLAFEMVPVLALGALAGVAAGAVAAWALSPVLDLSAFTDGWPAPLRVDSLLVVAALALVAVGVATALIVEAAAHRRLRLGEVLRVGEES